MPHALVTRPRDDAGAIAAALAERGYRVTIEPMMTVVPCRTTISLDGAQGALLTSRNGARALAEAIRERDIAIFAVGGSTASQARDLGFCRVESAGGDAIDLARLVTERLRPEDGPVVHATGRDGAGELARLLTENGFAVRREVLYEAVPVERLSDGLCGQLAGGQIDMALFFSPRTATIFAARVTESGLRQSTGSMVAACLSPAVANALAPLAWRRIAVARRPDAGSLLETIDGLAPSNREDPRARDA